MMHCYSKVTREWLGVNMVRSDNDLNIYDPRGRELVVEFFLS